MARVNPLTAESLKINVTSVSTAFGATMIRRQHYRFCSTTDCWILAGATPTAVANAAGNLFVPAGVEVALDGLEGPDLAVVRNSADGRATLTRCMVN